MERLTYWCDNGNGGGEWRVNVNQEEESGPHVDSLAVYEDTGLEPEEIELLAKQRDLYVDACGELPLKRIRELAKADREGRCVVLPCKVGDTIYFVGEEFYNYQLHSGLQKGQVKGFEFDKTWLVWVHFEKDTPTAGAAFKVKAFGKTVFLTREEAEEALRREQE